MSLLSKVFRSMMFSPSIPLTQSLSRVMQAPKQEVVLTGYRL